ncbi:endo alpha-1,4 polygalactosaminidase [Dactylosporangium vinaceum]|uniref:Endo alpha-1,4 polygalactosaminidase n=1 Tax=Dactylosporangium vinaceum TaxID=53362 RepID=A0ABV5MP20_9ACTN|nr:endo alpha-1,4 polygalactosaminidase [Dactylosporangium vinaceum]
MPFPGKRSRIMLGLAVTAAVAIAVGAGIGTADASTRGHWWGGGKPKPKPTASASVKPPTSPSPSASTKPSATSTASASTSTSPAPTSTSTTGGTVAPPPANASFDYQIGGPYTPPAGVKVVSRDHDAGPAAGLYNICYVNAFQAQTDANSWWKTNHPDLLLHDAKGNLVVDKDWNEILLDFSTAQKRAGLTAIVGGWIDGCAAKGFKGVEPDNLDSWTRSGGLLTKAQAIAYAQSLAAYAHGKGLAIGQKNTADLGAASARQIGFDFAVAEECADYNECGDYTAVYGNNVIVIEYSQSQFTKACNSYGSTLSIVLRDVDVTTPGSGSYVFKSC